MLELKFRDCLGQLKAELRVEEVDREGPFIVSSGEGLPEGGNRLLPQVRRDLGLGIGKKIDFGLQKAALLVERKDLKSALAGGKDVDLPVRRLLKDLCDARRAAQIHDASIDGQHHPKGTLVAEYFADHLLVPLFEDVEGQLCARQQHHVERKQWDQHS